jgi:hypothetical protein
VVVFAIIGIAVRPGGVRGPRAAAAAESEASAATAEEPEPSAHVADWLNGRKVPSRDARSAAAALPHSVNRKRRGAPRRRQLRERDQRGPIMASAQPRHNGR